MRTRTWRLHLLAAIFLLGINRSPASTVTNQPFRGITYLVRTETSPRHLIMHIALIDLTAAGLSFKVTPPGGTLDTVLQTTLEFLNQEQAQVAINAHFYFWSSNYLDAKLVGFAASQGTIYSPFEPQPIADGYDDQSYAILPYAPAFNIDPFNHACIVHLDPAYADHKHVLEQVTVWNALSGSAQIITDGVKNIPTYSGPPNGLNQLYGYSDQDSWYDYWQARTVIGLTTNNQTLVLFTVDETGGSDGMTPGEVADLLIRDYHVYNALNLDGGGSTTMAMQDPVKRTTRIVNDSSDGGAGRANGSNLAVFAQPNALTVTQTRSNLVLVSWPAFYSGWRLQQNPDLKPAHWSNVSTAPLKVGDRLQSLIAPQGQAKFYRLTK